MNHVVTAAIWHQREPLLHLFVFGGRQASRFESHFNSANVFSFEKLCASLTVSQNGCCFAFQCIRKNTAARCPQMFCFTRADCIYYAGICHSATSSLVALKKNWSENLQTKLSHTHTVARTHLRPCCISTSLLKGTICPVALQQPAILQLQSCGKKSQCASASVCPC